MSIVDIIGQIAPTLMMCLLIINIFQLRFSKIKTIIIFFMLGMIYYVITFSFSHMVLLKSFLSIIWITLFLLYFSVGSMKKRIISIIVYFVMVFSTEAIIAYIFAPLVQIDLSLASPNAMSDLRLVMVSLFSNLYIMEVVVVSVIYKDIRKDIKFIIIGLILFVFVPQVVFILSMLALVKDIIVQKAVWVILFSSIVTFIANLIVYILIEKLVQLKKEESELAYLKKQSEMMYDYYRIVMENVKETSALKHEISNQLQTVYGLFDDTKASKEETLRLLDGINENLSKVERVSYCNKPIVNTILSIKTAMAHEKDIETDILVGDIKNTTITDMDICSLFCNLYDNAIEACEKVDNGEKRLIRIRIAEKAGLLIIQFVNSKIEALTAEDIVALKTTKIDKRYHGYGKKLIRNIAEKYDGQISVAADKNCFAVTLSLRNY